MTDECTELITELRVIARLSEELASGSADAAGPLRDAIARVARQELRCQDRQLRHMLSRHSYAKALDYLEQTGG